MASRRSTNDPLANCDQPRWLVASTMHHAVIDSREIPPGADLRAVMRDAQAAMVADGWQPENDAQLLGIGGSGADLGNGSSWHGQYPSKWTRKWTRRIGELT
jgi:hypothetical protein